MAQMAHQKIKWPRIATYPLLVECLLRRLIFCLIPFWNVPPTRFYPVGLSLRGWRWNRTCFFKKYICEERSVIQMKWKVVGLSRRGWLMLSLNWFFLNRRQAKEMWVWAFVVVVTRNARGNNAKSVRDGLGGKVAGVLATSAGAFEN